MIYNIYIKLYNSKNYLEYLIICLFKNYSIHLHLERVNLKKLLISKKE